MASFAELSNEYAGESSASIRERGIKARNLQLKAVLQDIREYKKSLARLNILAQSGKSLEDGKVTPAKEAFLKVREKIRKVDEDQ